MNNYPNPQGKFGTYLNRFLSLFSKALIIKALVKKKKWL